MTHENKNLKHRTQHREYTPTRYKWLAKLCGRRQNLCFTLTGSFSCVWYYRSPDSFQSRNCLWHPLYRSLVVLIIPCEQKSVRGCQQFCFLFISSHVWCSTGLSAETCTVYHSQSLSHPSVFCRRHPASKINSTKWCTNPYTWSAIMYRRHKSMDVQQPTLT